MKITSNIKTVGDLRSAINNVPSKWMARVMPNGDIVISRPPRKKNDKHYKHLDYERVRGLLKRGQHSLRSIARICGCSAWKVNQIKKEGIKNGTINQAQPAYGRRDLRDHSHLQRDV